MAPSPADLLADLIALRDSGYEFDLKNLPPGLSLSDALLLRDLMDGIEDVERALDLDVKSPTWMYGEPLGIEAFSVAIDGVPLSPHQIQALHSAGISTASGLFSRSRTTHEAFWRWGKGCLAGSTELTDVASGVTKTVKEWAECGCPLWLWTWDGRRRYARRCSPAYKKGRDRLLLVSLADGRSVTVTPAHRFLAADGWVVAGEVRSGHRLCTDSECESSRYAEVSNVSDAGEGDFYDLTVPVTHCYFDDQGILHHNSGKDWLSARVCGWAAYVLNQMVEPKQWLRPQAGVSADERIDILNVAPKGDLAKQVFFEYLRRVCSSRVMEPFVPDPKGQIFTDRIVFPRLNLNLVSLNSSARGMDGYNPLIWVMDEADAFLDTQDKSNGDAVYKILRSSAATRWGASWLGLVLSYMRSGDGFLNRNIKRIESELATIAYHLRIAVVDTAASWEVNPTISKEDPTIQADYRNDPVTARAMYEGIAPPVVGGFFENYELIAGSQGTQKSLVSGRLQNEEEYVYRPMNGIDVPYYSYILDHVQRESGREYFAALDGGVSNDAFVFCVWSRSRVDDMGPEFLCPKCFPTHKVPGVEYGPLLEKESRTARCPMCYMMPYDLVAHYRKESEAVAGWRVRLLAEDMDIQNLIINGHRVSLPRLREDVMIRVKPIKQSRGLTVMVDFPAMEDVVARVLLALRPTYTRMDPWQTVQMRQSLMDRTSLDIGGVGFSNKDQMDRARLVKALLYNNCLRMLPDTGAQKEWEDLIRKNQRLDHPSDGSKDMFDAQSVAIWLGLCATLGTFDLQFLTETSPTLPPPQ